MSLEIHNLSVSAGDFTLSDVSLSIPEGECLVLMGKSGAGKTTLMEALCGLRSVNAGNILLGGDRVDHLRPGEREIGLVPQDSALFPHMTVREHIEFSLRLKKWSQSDRKDRVASLTESLGIDHLLDRKPKGLSGGEQKRAAIGRAIAAKPKLLCLDEAFTGLDDESSMAVIAQLKEMIQKEGITTLNITHRLSEAAALGGAIHRL